MKLLITEESQRINAKHLPAVLVDSFVNCVSASNERDIAAVADDVTSRRYVSFAARNTYAGVDTPEVHAYFSRIRAVPVPLIAHWLYTLDLTAVSYTHLTLPTILLV